MFAVRLCAALELTRKIKLLEAKGARAPVPPGAQPRFQSWGSNSLVQVIVQNKMRMVYPVSWTAVCYVTVITLFIKEVGVVRPNFGGPDPPTPQ